MEILQHLSSYEWVYHDKIFLASITTLGDMKYHGQYELWSCANDIN